jgi:hypothetical protein
VETGRIDRVLKAPASPAKEPTWLKLACYRVVAEAKIAAKTGVVAPERNARLLNDRF